MAGLAAVIRLRFGAPCAALAVISAVMGKVAALAGGIRTASMRRGRRRCRKGQDRQRHAPAKTSSCCAATSVARPRWTTPPKCYRPRAAGESS